MLMRDMHSHYTMIDMYARLGDGSISLRLAEGRLDLTEIAGVGNTCLYRLFGVQMSVLCLYDILTALLHFRKAKM